MNDARNSLNIMRFKVIIANDLQKIWIFLVLFPCLGLLLFRLIVIDIFFQNFHFFVEVSQKVKPVKLSES